MIHGTSFLLERAKEMRNLGFRLAQSLHEDFVGLKKQLDQDHTLLNPIGPKEKTMTNKEVGSLLISTIHRGKAGYIEIYRYGNGGYLGDLGTSHLSLSLSEREEFCDICN